MHVKGREDDLHTTVEEEKQILFHSIRLMICVGHADGYMSGKELSRIYRMVESQHFTLRERQIIMDDLDHPKHPDVMAREMAHLPRSEKLKLLRHLYQVAIADRKLSEKETAMIRNIAALLQIETEIQEQVEAWVLEGIERQERWRRIVGE